MSGFSRPRSFILGIVFVVVVLAISAPAEAQRSYEPLFDKFNFKAEFSWVGLSTSVGLFEQDSGRGGTLDFEDDLNLGSREMIPSLDFEWQIAKHHRLGGRWQSISRDSSSQALTDIQWGDETIPVNADISLSFDVSQFFVDYTWYPWVKDRWALGFGIGFRWLDLSTQLDWKFDVAGQPEEVGRQGVSADGPLPYLNVEYRRLLTEDWRMILSAGWLHLTVGDFSGGQWVGKASFEYLIGKRWAVGGAFNLATIDVDIKDLTGNNGDGTFDMNVNMDIWDLSIFGRVRF